MKKSILLLLQNLMFLPVFSQSLTTEIYLTDVMLKDSIFKFSEPVNITNHDGYDNQPFFTPDGKHILYVSMPDTLQTDIFQYTIADSTTIAITTSAESEYSPVIFTSRKQYSCVRVDSDKGQRLYNTSFELREPENLIHGLDSIAYYAWLNDSTVAIAFLNNGMELYIFELNSGQYVVMDKGIGRCLLKIPGTSDLFYTKKINDTIKFLRYNYSDASISEFGNGLYDTEDYTFYPDGKLLGGHEGKLFSYTPGNDAKWMEVADFSKSAGMFYRLAVSANGKHLAFVSYKGKRP